MSPSASRRCPASGSNPRWGSAAAVEPASGRWRHRMRLPGAPVHGRNSRRMDRISTFPKLPRSAIAYKIRGGNPAMFRVTTVLTLFSLSLTAQSQVERYGVFETALTSTGTYSNPTLRFGRKPRSCGQAAKSERSRYFGTASRIGRSALAPIFLANGLTPSDRTILA
jgi:hypothetical protein